MKSLKWTFAVWICPFVYCSHLCTLRMHHLLHNQVSFGIWQYFPWFFSMLFWSNQSAFQCTFAAVLRWCTSQTEQLYQQQHCTYSVFFNCTDLLGYKGWPCWLLHCPQLLELVDYAPCLLLGVCPDNMMAGWAVFLQMWLSKWIVPGKKVNFYNVAKNSLVSFGGWHGALLLVRAGLEVTVHVEVASDIQPGEQGSHKPGLCTP